MSKTHGTTTGALSTALGQLVGKRVRFTIGFDLEVSGVVQVVSNGNVYGANGFVLLEDGRFVALDRVGVIEAEDDPED